MRIANKKRFICFIATLMIIAGVLGWFIGASAFAVECEEPSKAEETESVEPIEPVETIRFEDIGTYAITAYCGCEKCCGEWSSVPVIGAGGVELKEGVHCAASLPLGTIIEIEGVGTYEVQDKPAEWVSEKYDGKIIDIYFDKHEDAVNFGKITARVKEVKYL